MYEEDIKEAFMKAFNQLITNKDEIIDNCEAMKRALTDTSNLDDEARKLQSELAMVADAVQKCIEENAHTELDQAEYLKNYISLKERYESIKEKLDKIEDKRKDCQDKREKIDLFILKLRRQDSILIKFDEDLWFVVVDKAKVYGKDNIVFFLKHGIKIYKQ